MTTKNAAATLKPLISNANVGGCVRSFRQEPAVIVLGASTYN